MSGGFALAPELAVTREIVGNEREPVLVIDGLLRDPAALVDFAAGAAFAPAYGADGGYPGLRAPAPHEGSAAGVIRRRQLRVLGRTRS